MSPPGKDEGYIILDAILSLLICAVVAGTVFASLGIVSRRAASAVERAVGEVEARNTEAARWMGFDASP